MRELIVFNNVSLDGYFADSNNDMSWAHKQDPEWTAFISGNAQGGTSEFVFGRVTYEMMASFWTTPHAAQLMPAVAEVMNGRSKIVFSTTLKKADWNNTTLITSDPVAEIQKRKAQPGPRLVIFGSGHIVSQLSQHNLIDEYQLIVHPVILGSGRTMFEGLKQKLSLTLIKSRVFGNGNVLLCYKPAM